MEKDLLKFLSKNTMKNKGHLCGNCRENYLKLIKLMRKNENYQIILSKDQNYQILHIIDIVKI
jgi:hypothetical protein